MPSDVDVWQSVEYNETTFEDGKISIVDARGRLPEQESVAIPREIR